MPNAFNISLITNIVNMLSTFPGLLMVERWGRRPLLLFGGIGMAVSQFLVGGLGTGLVHTDAVDKTSIVLICFFIFFYACSWGPTVWVVPGEIYSLKVRAKSLSISTACNWLINWAMSYSIPYLVDSGAGNLDLDSKVFFIWASCCVVACLIVWVLVYETRGLSLEQVDEMYVEINRAWESHEFVELVVGAQASSERRRRSLQTRSASTASGSSTRMRSWSKVDYPHSPKSTSYSCHVVALHSPTLEDDERHESGVDTEHGEGRTSPRNFSRIF